ncbi:MAG: stage II sporulation protein M [Candidatus Pacearchaeota archaeon]
MLESIINPKRVEKGPWKMFFVGLVYASLSLLLVRWFFSGDAVLSRYSGIMIVTFSVMFSIPFMYFIIKQEEEEDEMVFGLFGIWKAHKDAIFAFIWLFVGFVVAFSFWDIVIRDPNLFNAQIETYCKINNPLNYERCVKMYTLSEWNEEKKITGGITKGSMLLQIIENNIFVGVFTLIFSLIFGAGAIFVLSWNASVISAAISIFTQHQIKGIPVGITRYMIHGIPEITAYFIVALAGGMFGVSILRNGFYSKKFLHTLENVIILLFLALVIILIAGGIEVYFTPLFFK